MTRLRIALAQVNSTVGDLPGNAATVAEWTRRAADAGADLVVFPEMMLTGYPVEDLALRDWFVDASMATLEATARSWARRGWGTSPSSPATWASGRAGRPGRRTGQLGPELAALLYGGRSRSPRPSITCPITGCSTSTAISCPATGCPWSVFRYRAGTR